MKPQMIHASAIDQLDDILDNVSEIRDALIDSHADDDAVEAVCIAEQALQNAIHCLLDAESGPSDDEENRKSDNRLRARDMLRIKPTRD